MSKIKISGLIISAGLSGRMCTFKPLAIYKGKSFLHNIISKLHGNCEEVIIVSGHNSELLKSEMKKELNKNYTNVNFEFNESYSKGMFTSLKKGLSESGDCDWVVYHFVDQPGLPVEFYSELISQIDSDHNWIQPINSKRKGHPILLHKELFDLIISAPDNSNLRDLSFSNVFRKKYWECRDLEIFQDIDTDEDYNKLQ